MALLTKGNSPFYPGQPVPVELFAGRREQIQRIIKRGVEQVSRGKPVAMFIQGEYGIGKSSIANYIQVLAEKSHHLHGIYAPLGGCSDLNDMSSAVLGATIRSGVFDPRKSEKIKEWLAKYIGKQDLLGGLTLNFEALKNEAPALNSPHQMIDFLREAKNRLDETGVKGILLILDEINGITSNAQFAHFIKGLIDANALSQEPLPLLLMLCGVEERRREMIQKHEPVDRLFDIVEIEAMTVEEMRSFFEKAYDSVQIKVDESAMNVFVHHSAGFPKIMHLVGDAAYWLDQDGVIDEDDAVKAVLIAAEEVGKKYVDQQVYKALRSGDYRKILKKIAVVGTPSSMSFRKAEIVSKLTETEKKKFNNFLQKMKSLKVIRSGDDRGEYIFNVRMVRLYIWLTSRRPE